MQKHHTVFTFNLIAWLFLTLGMSKFLIAAGTRLAHVLTGAL